MTPQETEAREPARMVRMGLPFEFDITVEDPMQLESGLELSKGFWRRERAYQLETRDGDYGYVASADLYALDPETQITESPGTTISEFDIVHGVANGRMSLFVATDERWPEAPSVTVDAMLRQLVANVREFRRIAGYQLSSMPVFDFREGETDGMEQVRHLPDHDLPRPFDVTAEDGVDLQAVFDASVARWSSKTGTLSAQIYARYYNDYIIEGAVSRMLLDLTKAERMALVFNDLLCAVGAYEENVREIRRSVIAYADGKGRLVYDGAGRRISEETALRLALGGFPCEKGTPTDDIVPQVFQRNVHKLQAVLGPLMKDIEESAAQSASPLHAFAKALLEGAAEAEGASPWGKPV